MFYDAAGARKFFSYEFTLNATKVHKSHTWLKNKSIYLKERDITDGLQSCFESAIVGEVKKVMAIDLPFWVVIQVSLRSEPFAPLQM